MGLWDMVLMKDNHLKLFGGITEAVRAAKKGRPRNDRFEIEASNLKEALEAATEGADIIMLDNFTPKRIEKTISLLKENKLRKKTVLEASGGITKKNIRTYAKIGVDVISLGVLTHSAKAKDFSLRII